jgi:NAD(P)-dependent dehydrogenase (short-subunit alcohol dehydrogenase family)
MSDRISSPVALITGGTTGIGLATAHVLHKRGYAVLVTGRNPETLAAAERELPDDVVVFRADARSITDSEAVAAELQERFGRLDLAFLNAGVLRLTPLESLDEETYDWHVDTNLKGQIFALQKVLPLLGEGSSVIFTSSIVSERRVEPGMAVYAATKAAQLGLMRALAVELAPRGIRVNAVSPGVIETPALTKLGLPDEALNGLKDKLSATTPAGRVGTGEDVGDAVAFLASAEASFITGASITVDGGLTIT